MFLDSNLCDIFFVQIKLTITFKEEEEVVEQALQIIKIAFVLKFGLRRMIKSMQYTINISLVVIKKTFQIVQIFSLLLRIMSI